jgi:hypothetical protein
VVRSVLSDTVDAAISNTAYDDNIKVANSIRELGTILGKQTITVTEWTEVWVKKGLTYPVWKRGRTTGLKQGKLTNVDYEHKTNFKHQLLFSGMHFAEPGDSGSVVVNEQHQIIGLLTHAGGDYDVNIATPIQTVLDALQIELLCELQFIPDFASVSMPDEIVLTLQFSDPAPQGGLLFNLTSTNERVARVPETVIIQEGQTSALVRVERVSEDINGGVDIRAASPPPAGVPPGAVPPGLHCRAVLLFVKPR